jgi:TolA-binding protein
MNAYNNSSYADAQKMFEDIFTDYGIEDELYAAARYYSADALLKMGKKDEAATGFEFIVNNIIWSNFREESLYNLGLIYIDQEKYSKSRARLIKLLDEYEQSEYTGTAFYWIGESYSRQNRLQDAIDFLERAVNDSKNSSFKDYSIYTLATVYEKTEDYENAVKYYDQLLSYYPGSKLATSAHIRIGICYFYLKDYQSSILELNNPVISSLPEDLYSEGLYLLANSHYRVQEYENAEKTYSELIEKFTGSKVVREARYGLAWSYFQRKKFDDAYKVFNYLSDGEDSIAVESFIWKGEAKRYDNKQGEALLIYREFLQKFPTSKSVSHVEYLIGLTYFDQENYTVADKFLINATSSDDEMVRAKAFMILGEMELNNKKFIKAKQYLKPALNISDKSLDIYKRSSLALGIALYFLGENEEAANHLLEIEQIDASFEQERINFYLAENYFTLKNFQEALRRYDLVNTQDADIARQTLYGKAYCYFNLGDYESAAYQFNEFLERYRGDNRQLDVKLRLADSYFGSKNFVASSRVYKEIYASSYKAMDDPYTNYQYAQALYKSGETHSAITEFANLQKKFPSSKYAENSLYTVGWIHFQEGEFSTSINDYRNVLRIYKNSSLAPIVYYSIGDAFFNQGKYDSAIVNYQIVLTEYPSSEYVFDAVNGIQYSYVAMGKPERAVQLIDQFTAQNPNLKFSDQLYFKRGELFYSQRDYENAKISYLEFAAKYPKSSFVPEAYYWIGKSAENLGENEEAVFHFNKVFENYPESESAAAAVLEIGKIQNALGNYQATIDLFTNAQTKLKGSPRMPEILFNKGMTYIAMDNVQMAYEVFDELVMYYRTTLFADKAKFELGLIDLAVGRYEKADAFFSDLSGARTDDLGAKSQYYYGLSLFDQEKFTESISALVRVRTVFSNYDEWLTRSYLLLGDCYVKLGDKRKAEEMYRTVISKHRSDPFGEEARQKLRNL